MPDEPIISDQRDEHPRGLDFLVAPFVGAAMAGNKPEPLPPATPGTGGDVHIPLEERDGEVQLIHPNQAIMRVIKLAGFDYVVHVIPD